MAIHRIEPVTPEEENFRLEPISVFPGIKTSTIRRDHVARLNKGDYVALVFRITRVGRDCDGSALYAGENVNADGEATGFEFTAMSLQYGDDVKLDNPDDLIQLARD